MTRSQQVLIELVQAEHDRQGHEGQVRYCSQTACAESYRAVVEAREDFCPQCAHCERKYDL